MTRYTAGIELATLELADPTLAAAVRAGLDRVEERLRDSARSEYPFITEASRHLVRAGGKRFRPLLTLLASHLGDPDGYGVVPAAVVVELTHLATLYHDDVMDEAPLRRGAASANARWDNTVAILTGDFLFARASSILADLGPEAVRIQAETFERLCTGQILETVGPGPGEDPVKHYLNVVAQKTGSLIATAGYFGAMFADVPRDHANLVREFAETIGVAFQLSDDLLDVTAKDDESGKEPGTDLREGVRTLPVLYALQSTDPADSRLRELLSGPLTDPDAHAEALDLLRGSRAINLARKTLLERIQLAQELLYSLPPVPARNALQSLAAFVLARTG